MLYWKQVNIKWKQQKLKINLNPEKESWIHHPTIRLFLSSRADQDRYFCQPVLHFDCYWLDFFFRDIISMAKLLVSSGFFRIWMLVAASPELEVQSESALLFVPFSNLRIAWWYFSTATSDSSNSVSESFGKTLKFVSACLE